MRRLKVFLLVLVGFGLCAGYVVLADPVSDSGLRANPGWPLMVKFGCGANSPFDRTRTKSDTLCALTFLPNSEVITLQQVGLFFTGNALPEKEMTVNICDEQGKHWGVGKVGSKTGEAHFALFQPLRIEVGHPCTLLVMFDSGLLAKSPKGCTELQVAPLCFLGNVGDAKDTTVLSWVPAVFPVQVCYQ